MARFELGEEFVEVWLEADTLMTRRGRTGIDDPRPVVQLIGRDLVTYDREDDHIDPIRDGEHIARDGYTGHQKRFLSGGWRRVRDPDREADVGGEPRDPALDQALRADPDDDAIASVYADWLQQRGHPRGALIALQQRAELAAEAERLLQREAPRLLGPLAGQRGLELRWGRGFLRAAQISGRMESGEPEQLLWELLRHPSARLLRELVFRPGQAYGAYWDHWDYRLAVDLLLLHPPPRPPLSHLALGWSTDARLGELRGLDEAYPELEEVELTGNNQLELGELRLPRARRFVLRTVNLRRATLTSIIDGTWPELVELELWFGAQSECTLADLELLLDGTVQLPRLRVLRLHGVRFADELCARLARSWHAPTLEVLDLADGALTDRGAALLVAARETFERLRQVDVERCPLSDAARAGLRRFR